MADEAPKAAGPLAGLLVADFSRVLTSPEEEEEAEESDSGTERASVDSEEGTAALRRAAKGSENIGQIRQLRWKSVRNNPG